MKKNLSELLDSFEYDNISIQNKDPIIQNLVFDSRQANSTSLFFALPGTHVHGNKFILSAVKNGAPAVVYQDILSEEEKSQILKENENCILIHVPDSRRAMAPLAARFYDNPSKKLAVIGVTGTEGKSSTVSFIWQLLRLNGHKAGFISTVEYSLGDDALANPQHQTTPEAPIVQERLHQMLQNGCEYAVIESSSHGLSEKLFRLGHIDFDAAVFMNVTLEHLEFHKTFENYRNDKANLFRALDKSCHKKNICGKECLVPAFGIVNTDDPSADFFASCTKEPVYGFSCSQNSLKDKIIKTHSCDIKSSAQGIEFTLKTAEKSIKVKSPVAGTFNVYNVSAAILTVSKITQTDEEIVAKKAEELCGVKGRMFSVRQGQDFEVIIDYAHTPSSFKAIFPPLKERAQGKIICVFGSGGERDLEKRPLQGEVAAMYSDIIILADEDPRGEDPVELLQMIAKGAEKKGFENGKNLFIIPDRKKAIREALKFAKSKDIVLLLGKSHENSIIYKDYVMPYDETSEARAALIELGYKK